jgi:phenylacetate-CoA ligase
MTEFQTETNDASRHQLARSFYESLLESQWYSFDQLQKYQETILSDYIREVAARVPFYQNRLAHLFSKGEIDLTRWNQVPLLSRAELLESYDQITKHTIPSSHGEIGKVFTSGSSGLPLAIVTTSLSRIAANAAVWRHNHNHGIDWRKDIAFLRQTTGAQKPYNQSTEPTRQWGLPWVDLSSRGWMHRLSVHSTTEDQVAWLRNLGPVYLNTFPSNILRIARAVAHNEVQRPQLIAVLTAGEHVSQEVRDECGTHLEAKVVDLYSTGECGIVATDCPEGSGYHLLSELARIEILRSDGTDCQIGEQGELVITPLYNFAMPLVRYRTGDRATRLEQCQCGRGQPLVSRDINRDAAMFKLADKFVAPDLRCAAMERYLGRCRWQVVQLKADAFELRYMQTPVGEIIDGQGAVSYVVSVIGSSASVQVREVDAIGQLSSGKFQPIRGLTPQTVP